MLIIYAIVYRDKTLVNYLIFTKKRFLSLILYSKQLVEAPKRIKVLQDENDSRYNEKCEYCEQKRDKLKIKRGQKLSELNQQYKAEGKPEKLKTQKDMAIVICKGVRCVMNKGECKNSSNLTRDISNLRNYEWGLPICENAEIYNEYTEESRALAKALA